VKISFVIVFFLFLKSFPTKRLDFFSPGVETDFAIVDCDLIDLRFRGAKEFESVSGFPRFEEYYKHCVFSFPQSVKRMAVFAARHRKQIITQTRPIVKR
jgi:hypothetical protein